MFWKSFYFFGLEEAVSILPTQVKGSSFTLDIRNSKEKTIAYGPKDYAFVVVELKTCACIGLSPLFLPLELTPWFGKDLMVLYKFLCRKHGVWSWEEFYWLDHKSQASVVFLSINK